MIVERRTEHVAGFGEKGGSLLRRLSLDAGDLFVHQLARLRLECLALGDVANGGDSHEAPARPIRSSRG